MSFVQRFAAWSRQLVVRVYLFSSALIIISALVFFGIGIYAGWKTFQKMPAFILSTFCDHWDEPSVMQSRAHLVEELKIQQWITIYDAKNNLILTTIQPPLPPLSAEQLKTLQQAEGFFYKFPGQMYALAAMRDGALVGYGLHTPPKIFTSQSLFISCIVIFVVIAVFSIMFARSLAQPISRLSSVARAFGNGDLTARAGIRRNDELGYLGRTFDEMADRVNDLLRSQKELLANVSHELRTPLSRIRVALDIAAENASPADRQHWADIANDLEELDQLIVNILMATRFDLDMQQHRSASLPLHMEQIDPEPFLRAITDRFCGIHQSHVLDFSAEGPLPAITADPRLLRRVMENIIDNARKYSNDGSTIAIRAHRDAKGLMVEVSDSGIGIDEADLENVFKPFFRTDRSRTRSTGGVGLGLTLSKRIVEAHGGTISISSRLHSGTTVCFSIPCTSQSGNVPSS
jgi:signal transduction histidine kinase